MSSTGSHSTCRRHWHVASHKQASSSSLSDGPHLMSHAEITRHPTYTANPASPQPMTRSSWWASSFLFLGDRTLLLTCYFSFLATIFCQYQSLGIRLNCVEIILKWLKLHYGTCLSPYLTMATGVLPTFFKVRNYYVHSGTLQHFDWL